jgi:hypothetical protein
LLALPHCKRALPHHFRPHILHVRAFWPLGRAARKLNWASLQGDYGGLKCGAKLAQIDGTRGVYIQGLHDDSRVSDGITEVNLQIVEEPGQECLVKYPSLFLGLFQGVTQHGRVAPVHLFFQLLATRLHLCHCPESFADLKAQNPRSNIDSAQHRLSM